MFPGAAVSTYPNTRRLNEAKHQQAILSEPGPLRFPCSVRPSGEGELKGTLMNIRGERPVLPREQSCVCEVTEVTVVTPKRERRPCVCSLFLGGEMRLVAEW